MTCRIEHIRARRAIRRKLLAALGVSALALPFATFAQEQRKVARIGVLSSFTPANSAEWHEALRQSLRALGWVEGKNLAFEYRFANGKTERLAALASELARLNVDIIVADESTDAQAAQRASRTIPIVMASAGAAVEIGLVESLARPGGNITGLSQMTPELAGKHLELLREINPKLASVAVLWNPSGKTSELGWYEMQRSAKLMGVQLHSLEVRKPEELDQAFKDALKARAGALATMPNPVFASNMNRIVDFARKNRLPSTFHLREFAEAGGLVAYGPNRTEMFRRAATYVDKILKGAKAADLPIEQPTKFDLVVNLKTAKALGIKIPNSILVRADKVIK
jgi:putative ABC transport system substrate-binding protein